MSSANRLVILTEGKPWHKFGEQEVQPTKGKSKRGIKNAPPILYPVIAQAAELVSDQFWKSILNKAAAGIFSRRFQFENSTITYKVKNKVWTRYVDMSSPEAALSDIMFFMQNTAGIFSPLDVNVKAKLRKEQVVVAKPIVWSDLRSGKQRVIHVIQFVSTISKSMGLRKDQSDQLEETIRLGMLAGMFNATTIVMVESHIVRIEGLVYNETSGLFEIGANCRSDLKKAKKLKEEDDDESTALNYLKIWRKLMLNFKRKQDKYTSVCKRIN